MPKKKKVKKIKKIKKLKTKSLGKTVEKKTIVSGH